MSIISWQNSPCQSSPLNDEWASVLRLVACVSVIFFLQPDFQTCGGAISFPIWCRLQWRLDQKGRRWCDHSIPHERKYSRLAGKCSLQQRERGTQGCCAVGRQDKGFDGGSHETACTESPVEETHEARRRDSGSCRLYLDNCSTNHDYKNMKDKESAANTISTNTPTISMKLYNYPSWQILTKEMMDSERPTESSTFIKLAFKASISRSLFS